MSRRPITHPTNAIDVIDAVDATYGRLVRHTDTRKEGRGTDDEPMAPFRT